MTEGRGAIDPKGEYPADGFRLVEQNALRVLAWRRDGRVERTRDVIEISYGGDQGIAVLVTAETFEVRLPTIEWTRGAYGPADSSRLWRRARASALSDEALKQLLERGIRARRSQFTDCRYCGNSFPPERRHVEDVCHGCAERHLGIVH